MGVIEKIKLSLKVKGIGADWKCEEVKVVDQLEGHEFNFKINRWFSKKEAKEGEWKKTKEDGLTFTYTIPCQEEDLHKARENKQIK